MTIISAQPNPTAAAPAKAGAVAKGEFFGKNGLEFSDFLDVVNPLQHIPVIGEIYRSATNDGISTGARLAGGTLFGGPLGFAGALANTVVAEATGKDIGGNVVTLISDGPKNRNGAKLTSNDPGTISPSTATALAGIAPAAAETAGPPASYLEHRASLPAPPFPNLMPMAKITLR